MTHKTLLLQEELVSLKSPLIMGIVNVSSDSFYTGSRVYDEPDLLAKTRKMIDGGANIIDVGAVSTRPGAVMPSLAREWELLAPVLFSIRNNFGNIPISVDTTRARIAEMAVKEFGVGMINDISGGSFDPDMFDTVARLKIPYVLMHMRGTPENMQQHTDYDNIVHDMIWYFVEKIEMLHELGVTDIIVDPGFGFAKTLEQNYEVLHRLQHFLALNKPLLVGLSRKSMIWKLLNIAPEEALNATTALHTIALMNGASILRVHDVAEARQCVDVFLALQGKQSPQHEADNK